MKNYLDGGEAIVQAFRALDVDYCMSSPGSEWGALWEAFARQTVSGTDGPTYLSCWHETLAVDLAIGYTGVTGRMQAVVLHAGVGLLQGSMAIHAAQKANVPMIVMSGESLTYGEQQGFDPGHQWIHSLSVVGGPHRLVEPLVKWSNQATSSATLYESVVRAGEMAQRLPAGPVFMTVPIETMLQEWANPPQRKRKVPAAIRPRAPEAEIERIAGLLVDSRCPVLVADAAGREPESHAALLRLAEALSIPVVECGVPELANFPKEHPLHQGFSIQPFVDEADLVLTIRSHVPWYPPANRPRNAIIVAIDECPFSDAMVYQNTQADLFLEGDVPYTLQLLGEIVQAARTDAATVAERRARWSAAHDKRRETLAAELSAARSKCPISPVALCAALSENLPANAVYVDEITSHRRAIQNHLNHRGPQSYFKAASGLGQGLGHALGVKLAMRDRPVVSIIGDGGFLYNPITQSLGLAKEAELPIMIVVFNNGNYRAMKNNQLSYYPDGVGKQHNLFYGAPINGPDYAELVAPFGGFGRKVEDPADLGAAIQEGLVAINDGRTAILNVVVDP